MASAARAMPDGAQPVPGGWSRIVLSVADLAERVVTLQAQGVTFRNKVVKGPGGSQILVQGPSGNLIELFQSA